MTERDEDDLIPATDSSVLRAVLRNKGAVPVCRRELLALVEDEL